MPSSAPRARARCWAGAWRRARGPPPPAAANRRAGRCGPSAGDQRRLAGQRLVAGLVLAGFFGLLVLRLGHRDGLIGASSWPGRRPRLRAGVVVLLHRRVGAGQELAGQSCVGLCRTARRPPCRRCASPAAPPRPSARRPAAGTGGLARPAPSAGRWSSAPTSAALSASTVLRASTYFCSSASFSCSLVRSFGSGRLSSSWALRFLPGQRLDLRFQLVLVVKRDGRLQLDLRHQRVAARFVQVVRLPVSRAPPWPRRSASAIRSGARLDTSGSRGSFVLPEGVERLQLARFGGRRAGGAQDQARQRPEPRMRIGRPAARSEAVTVLSSRGTFFLSTVSCSALRVLGDPVAGVLQRGFVFLLLRVQLQHVIFARIRSSCFQRAVQDVADLDRIVLGAPVPSFVQPGSPEL